MKVVDSFIKKYNSYNENIKPVIGWTYAIPEEIIVSAGLHPYRLHYISEGTDLAKTVLPSNLSAYILSMLNAGMSGEYNFLSGLIVGNNGVCSYRFYDVWKLFVKTSFMYYLDTPKNISEYSEQYLENRYRNLISDIEKHFKVNIDMTKLMDVIETYNETRQLINKIYELRNNYNQLISGRSVFDIVHVAINSPKKEVNKDLHEIINEFEKNKSEIKDNRPRILVTGEIMDQPQYLEVIEEMGGNIVCEDFEIGIQYCRPLVSTNGDPIASLTKRYLWKSPTSFMIDSERRAHYIIDLCKEFKCNAVVFYTPKFTDAILYEYPYLKKKLLDINIPCLYLEIENSFGSFEQIRSRLQAFMEML